MCVFNDGLYACGGVAPFLCLPFFPVSSVSFSVGHNKEELKKNLHYFCYLFGGKWLIADCSHRGIC